MSRSRNSIQPESDPQALREYRQELRRLQAERDEARVAGGGAEVERLEGQTEALEAALKGDGGADTGERARDNVRKAITAVRAQLRRSGPKERAFEKHLRTQLSLGLEDEASVRALWGRQRGLERVIKDDRKSDPVRAEALRELEEVTEFLRESP